jgi:hypothetical protein
MGNTTCVYKKQELLTLGEHLGSLPLLAESVLLSFCSFLCCAMFFFVFVLFVFILCLGSNVACISGLFILDSLSWVQCCLYLWVVYTWLAVRFSLTFIFSYIELMQVFTVIFFLILSDRTSKPSRVRWVVIIVVIKLIFQLFNICVVIKTILVKNVKTDTEGSYQILTIIWILLNRPVFERERVKN